MDLKDKKATREICKEVLAVTLGEVIVSRIRMLVVGMGQFQVVGV